MSWLNGIFSQDAINKTVDAVIDTGDAIFYTDEEKAKAVQLKIETKLKMLPLFEPYKLAQRYLAIIFGINFIFAFWVGIVLYLSYPKMYSGYIEIVNSFSIGWIMLAIVSFYFGGGFIDSMGKNKK